jgi:hypothetical protein
VTIPPNTSPVDVIPPGAVPLGDPSSSSSGQSFGLQQSSVYGIAGGCVAAAVGAAAIGFFVKHKRKKVAKSPELSRDGTFLEANDVSSLDLRSDSAKGFDISGPGILNSVPSNGIDKSLPRLVPLSGTDGQEREATTGQDDSWQDYVTGMRNPQVQMPNTPTSANRAATDSWASSAGSIKTTTTYGRIRHASAITDDSNRSSFFTSAPAADQNLSSRMLQNVQRKNIPSPIAHDSPELLERVSYGNSNDLEESNAPLSQEIVASPSTPNIKVDDQIADYASEVSDNSDLSSYFEDSEFPSFLSEAGRSTYYSQKTFSSVPTEASFRTKDSMYFEDQDQGDDEQLHDSRMDIAVKEDDVDQDDDEYSDYGGDGDSDNPMIAESRRSSYQSQRTFATLPTEATDYHRRSTVIIVDDDMANDDTDSSYYDADRENSTYQISHLSTETYSDVSELAIIAEKFRGA